MPPATTSPPRPTASTYAALTLPQDAPVVRFRLAAIVAAQLFDYVTFQLMVQLHGIHFELNPIVSGTYQIGGFGILLVAKLALAVLVGATIIILGRRSSVDQPPSRLASAVTLTAVYGGLVGGISNTLMIL
jgi:hypothetical protein